MEDFNDIEILKEMFPHMKKYDVVIMGVNGVIRGNERGLSVRLDGWKNDDLYGYFMEGVETYWNILSIDDVPEVKEYKRLIVKRRKDKIEKLLKSLN